MRRPTRLLWFAALLLPVAAQEARAPRFYPDDPLLAEPAPRPIGDVLKRKFSDYFDFFYSSFGNPAGVDPKAPIPRAQAVNTLGEPMDSTWWQRRHYYRPMSTDELVHGPNGRKPPSANGKWTVVASKNEGITPGFDIVDETGQRYKLKFDPISNPEMASAPDVLVARILYALGYNVPDNYIVELDPDRLVIKDGAMMEDNLGRKRAMNSRDITEILIKVPRSANGRYRALASRFIAGSPIGPFRYWGVRRDDPNDTVPHEHRRDLRGYRVACAWLGHDDSRSVNTADFVERDGDRRFVRHYMIDFGSTLGSGTQKANSPRSGFEYLWQFKSALLQFFTFGLAVPEWARADFPNLPSVGRFEHEKFDALNWKAEYPNPAFTNCLPDDGFWMAKQVMAFDDEQLKAIVKTGQYSDPKAEAWVLECLIKRRDKIGRAWFAQVLPLDRFAVRDGRLAFDNLAAKHGFTQAQDYQTQWAVFDNLAHTRTPIAGAAGLAVPESPAEFIVATVRGADAGKPVDVYLRLKGGVREVVGVEHHW